MTKVSLTCRDLGLDCDFIVMARNEEKLLKKAAKHAKHHKLVDLPPDLVVKAKAAIKTNP